MAEEYTPTTEQVRGGFAHDPEGEYRDPINYPANHRANLAAFDRWLAARDAEKWRQALEEAATEAESSTRPLPGKGVDMNSGSRSQWYAFGVRDAATRIRALAEKGADRG